VGGLTSALGSAVAGAADAVAGAASALAGASAAAIAAAGGPLTLSVPEPSQAVISQDYLRVGTVRFTKRFWVRASDVAAISTAPYNTCHCYPAHHILLLLWQAQNRVGQGSVRSLAAVCRSSSRRGRALVEATGSRSSSRCCCSRLWAASLLHYIPFALTMQRYSCIMAGCTCGRRRRRSRRGRLGRRRAQMAARA
jgi:hypothetical protein